MTKILTLLIVDDSEEDQLTYERYLLNEATMPPKIVFKSKGASALDYLMKNAIDCILLDYQLPDMSGIEFITKLRGAEYPKIPVVMLTEQGNEKVAVEALKLGAFDYLIKGELEGPQLHQSVVNAIEKFDLMKKLDRQKKENEFLAYHDPLTNLFNRRQFVVLAEHCLLQAKRFKRKFACISLDLDGFKEVNESQGHDAGDQVLIEVSKRFLSCLRKNDILARIGGDEFCILLEDSGTVESVTLVVDKLIGSLNKVIILKEGSAKISVSIGVAIYPENGDTIPLIMKNADNALYEAKEAGKSTFRFAQP